MMRSGLAGSTELQEFKGSESVGLSLSSSGSSSSWMDDAPTPAATTPRGAVVRAMDWSRLFSVVQVDNKKLEQESLLEERIQNCFFMAVEEKAPQLEYLKFLIGPELEPIKYRYENKELNQIKWRIFRESLQHALFNRIKDGVLIYFQYVKLGTILSIVPDQHQNKKLKLYSVEVDSFEPVNMQMFSKGLKVYQEYLESNLNNEFYIQLENEWTARHIDDKAIESKDDLKSKLNNWVSIWCEDIRENIRPGLKEMIDDLISKGIKEIEEMVNSKFTITYGHIINEINNKNQICSHELELDRKALKKKLSEYTKELNVAVSNYTLFSTKWADKESNFALLMPLLRSSENYKGVSLLCLIDFIVSARKRASYEDASTEFMKKSYHALLSKGVLEEEKVQSLFSSRIISHKYEKFVDLARRFHKEMISIENKLLEENDELEKEKLSNSLAMPASILEPIVGVGHQSLSLQEILEMLKLISCKSEFQENLRGELLSYVSGKIAQKNYGFMNIWSNHDRAEKRRYHLAYLTSCLFLASSTFQDQGILFNVERLESIESNCHNDVGINFIIKVYAGNENAGLSGILNKLMEAYNARKICFLPKVEANIKSENGSEDIVNIAITNNAILRAAITPIELSEIAYQSPWYRFESSSNPSPPVYRYEMDDRYKYQGLRGPGA